MNDSWHHLSEQEVGQRLGTNLQTGLDEREAGARLEAYGPNELAGEKRRSLVKMFLAQFKEALVLLLLAAVVISAAIGEFLDAGIILAILIINAFIGAYQEARAERALAALKKMTQPLARVLREGKEKEIPVREVVPGDVVILEEGDFVPADARLVFTVNLAVDESALTGESVPVEKETGALSEEVTLVERRNMVYAGTVVTRGRGRGVVVSTGMNTEIGHIAGMLASVPEERTPLQERLGQIGKWLGFIAVSLCVVLFGIGVSQGRELWDMFLLAVALAVAAVPEGLPAVITVVLALGVQRMAHRRAIVRHLPAVETLGSATYICTDKTGTLTKNEMEVQALWAGGKFKDMREEQLPEVDVDTRALLLAGALCNNAVVSENGSFGDPTELALLKAAHKYGLSADGCPRLAEIPFDSERKLMTTVHLAPDSPFGDNGGYFSVTKGAPDVLLSRCDRILLDGEIRPLDEGWRQQLRQQAERLYSQAYRVLGLGFKPLDVWPQREGEGDLESGIVFIGFQGMMDPLRPEAREAVETCRRAGIRPVMITGDHPVTAQAIGKEIGLLGDGVAVTGADLEETEDDELDQLVLKAAIYARTSPAHKLRIVEALRRNGQVVAMTGDGVNDAPALRRAHIGVAMGITGTDVAKEAADLVITDDNFATIVSAVREGRVVFDNIRKVIYYLVSCNAGELLVLFAAILAGLPSPLTPIQILWLNLVTDSIPALALGVEPPEKDVMARPPVPPHEGVFSGGLGWRAAVHGGLIGVLGLLGFLSGSGVSTEAGRTMAFAVLILSQLVHALNARSLARSVVEIGFFTNPNLLKALAVSALLQVAIFFTPVGRILFEVVPLSLPQWGIVALLSLLPLVAVEAHKLLRHALKMLGR